MNDQVTEGGDKVLADPLKPTLNDFLRAMYPTRREGERIEIRVLREQKMHSRVFTTVQQASWFALKAVGDVYFGVGLRSGEGRGNDAVKRLGAVWCELDFKDKFTEEVRRGQLAALPIAPSIVVNSGGGLHLYWLLDVPCEDTEQAKRVMQSLEQRLNSDHIHDPARILRVPYTQNHKYTPARWVTIESFTPEQKVSVVALETALKYSTEEVTSSVQDHPPPLRVADALAGVPEGGRDNALFKLVVSLHKARVPKEYAAALVKEAASKCTPPYPIEQALRKVQTVYSHEVPPTHGIAFNIPAIHRMEEVSMADLAIHAPDAIHYLPLIGEVGYFVEGWSHLVAGYPRSGKTELLAAACSDWALSGKKVLYATEESVDIWARRAASRKLHTQNYNILFGLGHGPEALFSRVFSGEEEVVVIDTLRNLLGLRDETDNSKLAEAINPWVAAARANNKTFILAHHTRKGGGAHGEGIAGGHGLLGMFDIAIEVLRDNHKANRRIIRAYARLISPPELLYGLEGTTFKALGQPDNVSAAGLANELLDILKQTGVWMSTRDVMLRLDPQPSEATLRRALLALAEEGQIERIPPLSAGAAQGQTPYWHFGAGNALA